MMRINRFWFTKFAKKRLKEVVPPHLQYAFNLKLTGARIDQDFDSKLKPLRNLEPATHTARLGNDRLILYRRSTGKYWVLDIENLRRTWEESYN